MSLYALSIPVLRRGLVNMIACLDKGVAWCAEKGLPESELLDARLAPDMHPLTRQYQIASDAAKGAGGRLTGGEPPSMVDTEASFAELRGRVQRTIDYLDTVDPATVDAKAGTEVLVKLPGAELRFAAEDFLASFVFPNFFFHASMAYAIMRMKGVPLGKMDYLQLQDVIVRTPAAA
ncbi:DUF1993 domain-containing protein [Sphingomonas crocodyli]|uniref:DUF1993 domain-containing protein n=1 Tax=Sphingomonas crocodyli TaxID=1979270 RepID=A0A437M4Q5_9SPHN|nr:DUF1993 domain-containing protein [Sphingomonas crocodyli]RVT92659.1 DUF1993 domain-containing protein [Sphingomonas crocodyli]